MPPIKKYSALKPKIANTFEVITINGSLVIANTAGIESIANTKSVNSIIARPTSNGVACITPLIGTMNLFPTRLRFTGKNFLRNLTARFFSNSIFFSSF